jgi:4'-phosphopantetheinyl transferase EntD
VWPAGTVGSISHGSALAIAVAAAVTDFEALGVDVEDDRVERSLVDVIASPSERRRLGAAGAEEIERALALRFSAKEALYKALPAEVGDLLDMTDVAIRLDGAGSFAGRPDGRRQACTPELVDLLARTTGVWIVLAGAVVTFAWRPAPAGSARACRARIAVSACSSEPPR